MANGSSTDGPAKADRLREKYAAHKRSTQRALDELPPYREEFDSVSEVTAGPDGVKAKGVPRLGMLIISVAIAVFIVALGAWLVK